jgi:hypothetical protein
VLVALYGVLNAAAYSCLMPLWEGFDEGYHYGYVQMLSAHGTLPVLGRTVLTREIWHAYELAPVSHYLQPFTGAPLNFGQYFAMTREDRARRRAELDSIVVASKYELQRDKANYEANQSPLPYIFMAPFDWAMAGLPLTARVLALRLICSILAVLLLAHSTLGLARELGLTERYAAAALFCVFSAQMLYATICHVSNDWLAIPVMTYLLWAAIRAQESGSARDHLLLGVALSVGLLAKAYYLFLVPLPFLVAAWALWRKRTTVLRAAWMLPPLAILAAPWFARNVILYHNLAGTVEQTKGLELRGFLGAVFAVPWAGSIAYMAHTSLWTGNNSFTAFSSMTLNVVLALLAAGVVCNFVFGRPGAAEWIATGGIVLFSTGLAFSTVAFFISSKGGVFAAFPWYMQTLLSPVLLMAFLGLSRARAAGRVLFPLTVVAWAYLIAATYLAKLGPMYGGYPPSRAHLSALWTWYWSGNGDWSASLAGGAAAWVLIALTMALCLFLCGRLTLKA